jgi:hypothetical protein
MQNQMEAKIASSDRFAENTKKKREKIQFSAKARTKTHGSICSTPSHKQIDGLKPSTKRMARFAAHHPISKSTAWTNFAQ